MQGQGEQNESCSPLSLGPVGLGEDEPAASLQGRGGERVQGLE